MIEDLFSIFLVIYQSHLAIIIGSLFVLGMLSLVWTVIKKYVF